MSLAAGLKFNKTIVKLGLANNALKACVVKFLLESLLDNFCLAELSLAGNFLDNEFAVDLAHLLESNQTIHTVDISKNPIGPEGAKILLQSILQYNDTLESLGDDMDSNMYMGVRMREEMK
jgi:Ran GTPase-activating protein (RanGAP) involved in mRNA processing and transport